MNDDRFLWYDNEGALEQRLQRAAAAYQQRRGHRANICELLPEAINGDKVIAGMELKPKVDAMKNHYWLTSDAEIPEGA